MTTAAQTLATELGGQARELREQAGRAVAIELADGRVPLLVRDFGHVLWISLAGTRPWHSSPGQVNAATLGEVVTATRAWAKAGSPEDVTLYELALHVPAVLNAALDPALDPAWTVSFPGVPEPSEAWVRGPDGGSVGLFPGRVLVWVGSVARECCIATRRDLVGWNDKLVAAVREQLAAFQANVAISERIRARAEDLAAQLSTRLADACRSESWDRPNHAYAIEAWVRGSSGELARVFARAGEVWIHAGLPDEDGWEGRADESDLEAIVEAIERAAATLTIHRLIPGHRYRVLADLGDLRAGMVVRFVGIDELDNHYGIGEFVGPDGQRLAVPGDYSTPRNSPLGPAYRYLEALDER